MLSMLIGLAIAAQAASAPAQAQAPANPANTDPVICKTDPIAEVGTHMKPKPTCMKKSEWDYVEGNTKQKLQLINSRGSNPYIDPGR